MEKILTQPPFEFITLTVINNTFYFQINGIGKTYDIYHVDMISEVDVCLLKKGDKQVIVKKNDLQKGFANLIQHEGILRWYNNTLETALSDYKNRLNREVVALTMPNSDKKVVIKYLGTSFVVIFDGRETELDPYKIIQKAEHGKQLIRLKKTSTADLLVNVDELTTYVNSIVPRTESEEKYLSRIKKQISSVILKGEVRVDNAEHKSNSEKFDTMLRNLECYKIVFEFLQKGFSSTKENYIEKRIKEYVSSIEYIQKKLADNTTKSLYAILLNNNNYRSTKDYYDKFSVFFNDRNLKSNYMELIADIAKKEITALENMFLIKNSIKISTIVYYKSVDLFDSIETIRSMIGTMGFEGDFLIKFKDNTFFEVRTQAVYVEGFIQSKHFRFPTTFHNIKSENNTFSKLSEEQMINLWKK